MQNEDHILSPLTGGPSRSLEMLSTQYVADCYAGAFDIDISGFLPAGEIDLRLCEDTGYRFFHPPEVEGPPAFYERLYARAGSDWAYGEDKWEYGFARRYLSADVSVLDCGCGGGEFLGMVRDEVAEAKGLETNAYGRDLCRGAGLDVAASGIEEYAAAHAARHDVVTAFQVLEHIHDVRGFLEGCLRTLRPGGRLILSVPNNDSFIRLIPDLPTNLPPHHVGRWTPASLAAIARHFDVTLDWIETEPLHARNIGAFASAVERTYLPRSRLARSLYHRLGIAGGIRRFLAENAASIAGHTVVAVFRKPGASQS